MAQGGVITFDCGPEPVLIELTETAKIYNDRGPKIVIDGGGKVTLSGRDQRRILYQNTCEKELKWTTSHCDDQDHPQLTVQNLTFVHGSSKGMKNPDGGGAIFVRGGRFKLVNTRFSTTAATTSARTWAAPPCAASTSTKTNPSTS